MNNSSVNYSLGRGKRVVLEGFAGLMTAPVNSLTRTRLKSFWMEPSSMKRPSPWGTAFAKRTYLGAALLATGMLVGWLTETPGQPGWLKFRLDGAGLLYTAASAAGGANFFGAGFRALRKIRLDMNFLMSVAIMAAILIGEPFEAATLAVLFSVAELLERFAVDRSRRSVEALLELAPEQAERIRPDGRTETVPAAALTVGDRIRARPGHRIAADGRVLTGQSAVNEAAITGESIPAVKSTGDQVFSGSLNAEGVLDIEITADAAHSVLARIAAMVRAAEARKAPIEQAIERFARVYTPVVTALAVLVIVVPPAIGLGARLDWFVRGITLLVIACPCALVIATPVTVVSALTSAARHGVLIKGGEHLERLGAVRALATDKTGTLTSGLLDVTSVRTQPAAEERTLLGLIAAVESRSEHPIARAIVEYTARLGIPIPDSVSEFTALPGRGVIAKVNGVGLTVGTEDLVGRAAVERWGELNDAAIWIFATTENGGSTCLSVADTVRAEAKPFVDALHGLGIRPVVLLTGDRPGPAAEVGGAVGVDLIRARLMPEDKVAAIRDLRERYGSIAMVGDGVNDSPALAEANVGIAMGAAGSPAAIETADVALMADDLTRIPYAIQLSRVARRTVRINIAVALGLKLALAVGAVLGVVSLAVAVIIGDMGGSLLVTLNSLRLAGLHPSGRDVHRRLAAGPHN
ncbi:MAG: cation-translocating P-type ATPase [Gemmatimonadales bacterium]|nr:cation-translocating P-type ATPase [Gemmatimonadales bacterium]